MRHVEISTSFKRFFVDRWGKEEQEYDNTFFVSVRKACQTQTMRRRPHIKFR